MPTSSARVPLFGALLVYFILVVALIFRVPWEASPDEAAHAQYVQAIATTHALPVFQGQSPPAPGYEFHQPPLYYLVAAPLWAITPPGVQNYAVRGLSLVFGLLTIWVVWCAANLVFGRGSRATSICTLGAALSPLHQGVAAGVNNDSLAGLWAACLFYLVARAWLEGPTKRLILLVGIVAGLGALTKLTVIVLGTWAFAALWMALAKRGERPVLPLVPAFGVAVLLAAPMMLRNQSLYGDPFAYALFSRAATRISPGFLTLNALTGMPFFTYLRAMVWQIIGTAWGFYGGPNTLLMTTGSFTVSGPRIPDPLLLLPLLLVVVVPLGAVWSAWKTAQGTERSPEARALSLWWGIGVLLVVLLWANFAFSHQAGGQARYLHGALLPLVLLAGGALSRTRTGTIAAALLGLTMLALTLANIFVWKTLV